MLKELISEIRINSKRLPLHTCFTCSNLLKECVCFGFKLVDDAMDHAFGRDEKQRFKAGDSVTAVRGLEPMQGCYVVACHSAEKWTLFRRYIIENGKSYLEALNPTYPTIAITPDIEIIGVVKAYHFDLD